jgi:hypothetical protein
MADLDVSEVLDDPFFTTTFSIVKTSRVVNSNGVGVVSNETQTDGLIGIIIPNKGSLSRFDDGSRLSESLEVYTKFQLSQGTKIDDASMIDADIIIWKGKHYVVSASNDFSDFGRGFYHSTADLIDFNVVAS